MTEIVTEDVIVIVKEIAIATATATAADTTMKGAVITAERGVAIPKPQVLIFLQRRCNRAQWLRTLT